MIDHCWRCKIFMCRIMYGTSMMITFFHVDEHNNFTCCNKSTRPHERVPNSNWFHGDCQSSNTPGRWRANKCTRGMLEIGDKYISYSCWEVHYPLQNVAILLGLRIDGMVVIGQTNLRWSRVVRDMLGTAHHRFDMKGRRINTCWLDHHFGNFHQHVDDELWRIIYIWTYILRSLVGWCSPIIQAHMYQ